MVKLGFSSRTRFGPLTKLTLGPAIAFALAAIISLLWSVEVQAQDPHSRGLASLRVIDKRGATIDVGTFDPAVTNYSATVGSAIERVTVRAFTKVGPWADVYISPGDSQTVSGHQVELSYGVNLILVSVYGHPVIDEGSISVYSVTITRAGSAPEGAPTNVSISSPYESEEGYTVPFLLTRTGNTTQALTVPVDVTEDLDMLPSSSEGRVNVEFQAGYASARLDLPTNSNSVYQGTSLVRAALVDGDAYDVDPSTGVAHTLVRDDDFSGGLKPTLDSITLADQTGSKIDIGSFDADTKAYSVSVGSEIEWITVDPTATHPSSFPARILPSDSRPKVIGHQVDLSHGVNLISIVVRSLHSPGNGIGTYEISVNRAGSAPDNAVRAISVHGFDRANEGDTLPFLLTRTGDTSQALTVQVDVSETGGEMVSASSEGRSDVKFPAGDASARFEVATNADQDWEEHSTVAVAVVNGDGYEASSEFGSASSEVRDNDVPGVTAAFSVDSSEVEEGSEVTVTVTVKTDEPQQPHAYVGNLIFVTEPGTAWEEDFELENDRIDASRAYTPDADGRVDRVSIPISTHTLQPVVSNGVVTEYQRQITIPVRIADDDRPEPDETFTVLLGWRTLYAERTLTIDQDISSHTITILEHEETPETPDPISHVTVNIADSGSAGSTYTVTWNDAGRCTRDYRAYLAAGVGPFEFDRYTGIYEQLWGTYRTLGIVDKGSTQLVKTLDEFPFSGQRTLQVFCGDRGRLVSQVPLPSRTENSIERPVPGTYSSEPALTSLTVSPGTLGPAFANHGFLYAVLDVPYDDSQITLNAAAKAGYTISWDPSNDADPNTDGHQVELEVGWNSIFASVDHDQGVNAFVYEVIVKRAGSPQPSENQAPTVSAALGDATIVNESEALEVALTGVFSDANNDALTVTASSSNEAVAIVYVATDYSALTVLALAQGAATITVTADDGNGGKVEDTFTVTVKAAPVVALALADVTDLKAQSTRVILLSGVFSDADGDALTVTAASSNEIVATASVATDQSSLTVSGVAEGTATITVTAEDSDGNRVSDAFEASVAATPGPEPDPVEIPGPVVNHQLTGASDSVTVNWQAPVSGGVPQRYIVNLKPEGGGKGKTKRLKAKKTSVTFKNLEAGRTYKVWVRAQNEAGKGERVHASITLPEEEPEQGDGQQQQGTPNQAPTVSSTIADGTIVNESGTRQVSLSGVFSDADNDALTVTAVSSDETKATVSVATDYSTLTVTAQARGPATITVTADDGNGGTVEDSFTVTVKAAPVVASALADVSGLEVGATQDVSLSGVFSDADGDALTITAAPSDEAKATVTPASDGSKLTLAGVAEGTTTITVMAEDSDGNRVSETFDVSVARAAEPANRPPTVSNTIADATIVNESGTKLVSLTGVFGDADNDALTVTAASSDETKATVSVASDYSSLTVTAQTRGMATITVTANDGKGGTGEDSFTVTVKAAPVVVSALADVSGLEEGATQDVSLSGVFSDADGDTLTITAASSDETIVTVSVASGGSKLTLTGVAEGTTTITVTAQDSDGNRVSDAFEVEVEQEEEEKEQPASDGTPTVVSPLPDLSLEVLKYKRISLAGVFADPNGDDLTFSASASDYSVVVIYVSGSRLTVIARTQGTATITVTAEDPDGNTVSDAFEVTVRPAS